MPPCLSLVASAVFRLDAGGDARTHGGLFGAAADAVCSRVQFNTELALQQLRSEGISVLGAEAWLFAFLGSAGHPSFKEISALLK